MVAGMYWSLKTAKIPFPSLLNQLNRPPNRLNQIMRLFYVLPLFALNLLLSGCEKDPPFVVIPGPPTSPDGSPRYGPDTAEIKLNFFQGQRIRYILIFYGGFYDTTNFNVLYPTDTLELEVLGVSGDTFQIQERLTPYSNIRIKPEQWYYGKEHLDTCINNWFIRNDSLILQSVHGPFRSHLLDRPDLYMRDFRKKELELKGFKPTKRYRERDEEYFAEDLHFNDYYFPRVNVYINNSAMALDWPGNFTVYHQNHGIIFSSWYAIFQTHAWILQ